jgi:hypothetical protein
MIRPRTVGFIALALAASALLTIRFLGRLPASTTDSEPPEKQTLEARIRITEIARAASELQVPPYCVPAMLPGLQQLLARTTDAEAQQLLIAKINIAERQALECAAAATMYPPLKKPIIPIRPPTVVPAATATLLVGLQYVELGAGGDFVPMEDGLNKWAGFIYGNVVEVAAGRLKDTDNGWQLNHPEWVAQGSQGAVFVVVNHDKVKGTFPTPSRHGVVHFIAACGSILLLQAEDGTVFSFDAARLAYVDNLPSCPVP